MQNVKESLCSKVLTQNEKQKIHIIFLQSINIRKNQEYSVYIRKIAFWKFSVWPDNWSKHTCYSFDLVKQVRNVKFTFRYILILCISFIRNIWKPFDIICIFVAVFINLYQTVKCVDFAMTSPWNPLSNCLI